MGLFDKIKKIFRSSVRDSEGNNIPVEGVGVVIPERDVPGGCKPFNLYETYRRRYPDRVDLQKGIKVQTTDGKDIWIPRKDAYVCPRKLYETILSPRTEIYAQPTEKPHAQPTLKTIQDVPFMKPIVQIEEAKRREEEEAQRREEEEAKRREEEEAKRREEEEARLKAEEEARLKAEEEARLKAEEEAREKAEREARLQTEAVRRMQTLVRERARKVAAAKKVQAVIRGQQIRNEQKRRQAAAKKIQKARREAREREAFEKHINMLNINKNVTSVGNDSVIYTPTNQTRNRRSSPNLSTSGQKARRSKQRKELQQINAIEKKIDNLTKRLDYEQNENTQRDIRRELRSLKKNLEELRKNSEFVYSRGRKDIKMRRTSPAIPVNLSFASPSPSKEVKGSERIANKGELEKQLDKLRKEKDELSNSDEYENVSKEYAKAFAQYKQSKTEENEQRLNEARNKLEEVNGRLVELQEKIAALNENRGKTNRDLQRLGGGLSGIIDENGMYYIDSSSEDEWNSGDEWNSDEE